MSRTQYEVTAIVGSYTNSNGEKKNRFQRIGSVIDTKNGLMLKLDLMPLTDEHWNGWAYLNVPKPKEPKEQFEDSSIPF